MIKFAAFILHPDERQLYRDGVLVPLTPKVFDILVLLVKHQGKLVDKSFLMQSVWQESFVEENNLTFCISVLRKALSDNDPMNRRFIETIPKHGYRFIAPAEEFFPQVELPVVQAPELVESIPLDRGNSVESNLAEVPVILEDVPIDTNNRNIKKIVYPTLILLSIFIGLLISWLYRRPTISSAADIHSLAVLPFNLIANEKESEFLGPGIADALINRFSKIPSLEVRPLNSVIKYHRSSKEGHTIGRELGVQAILLGNIQKNNNEIRITSQLVRVSDGVTLWSGTFDDQISNIFKLEDDISYNVATLFNSGNKSPSPSGSPPHSTKTEAYLAYLKGMHSMRLYTSESWKKSVGYFEEAIRIDPTYAQAYAGLAEAYVLGADLYMPPQLAWPRVEEVTKKALSLNKNMAEAYIPLALLKMRYELDWQGGEQILRQAIALDPRSSVAHDWYGWYLLWLGRMEEAYAELQEAHRLDPLSTDINVDIATYYYCQRNYQQAMLELNRVIEFDPNSFSAHSLSGWVYVGQNKPLDALREFERCRALDNAPFVLAALIHANAIAGDKSKANSLLHELQKRNEQDYVPPIQYVYAYLGMGDYQQALNFLDKAYLVRDRDLILLKMDPIFDPLRANPRFIELLAKLNLPSA